MRVWHVESGQCRGVIQGLSAYGRDLLVVGCEDGAVLLCEMMEEGNHYQARLRWGSTKQCAFRNGRDNNPRCTRAEST